MLNHHCARARMTLPLRHSDGPERPSAAGTAASLRQGAAAHAPPLKVVRRRPAWTSELVKVIAKGLCTARHRKHVVGRHPVCGLKLSDPLSIALRERWPGRSSVCSKATLREAT